MYPEKGQKNGTAGSGEEQPIQDGLMLDDDWAGHRLADKGRRRSQEDSELDLADDSLLML